MRAWSPAFPSRAPQHPVVQQSVVRRVLALRHDLDAVRTQLRQPVELGGEVGVVGARGGRLTGTTQVVHGAVRTGEHDRRHEQDRHPGAAPAQRDRRNRQAEPDQPREVRAHPFGTISNAMVMRMETYTTTRSAAGGRVSMTSTKPPSTLEAERKRKGLRAWRAEDQSQHAGRHDDAARGEQTDPPHRAGHHQGAAQGQQQERAGDRGAEHAGHAEHRGSDEVVRAHREQRGDPERSTQQERHPPAPQVHPCGEHGDIGRGHGMRRRAQQALAKDSRGDGGDGTDDLRGEQSGQRRRQH